MTSSPSTDVHVSSARSTTANESANLAMSISMSEHSLCSTPARTMGAA